MKILYFDCFSGISGDMTLGALLDLGIDQAVFKKELSKLHLNGYHIDIVHMDKMGIKGTDVQVVVDDSFGEMVKRLSVHETSGDEMQTSHEISSVHHRLKDEPLILAAEHERNSHHEHHEHHEHHGHEPSRNLTDIYELIDHSELKESVKILSKKIFEEIAIAEGKVHNKPVHEVHFHEVGAVDSIVDIVGVAICLDLLNIRRVYSSPVHDGQGFIQCAHGILPVPVPAVMEMLSGSRIPYISEDINTEMVTPTGLGILKCVAKNFGSMPAMMVDRVGYGFGKRELGRLNALRIVLGDSFEEDMIMEDAEVMEANIDDLSPEILGFVMEKLFAEGALDVFYTPIYMKKNRPAVKLSVIAKPKDEGKILSTIFNETTTLGIRKTYVKRFILERRQESIDTPWGMVRVKIAKRGEKEKFSLEYEDLRKIAMETGLAFQEVYDRVYRNLPPINFEEDAG